MCYQPILNLYIGLLVLIKQLKEGERATSCLFRMPLSLFIDDLRGLTNNELNFPLFKMLSSLTTQNLGTHRQGDERYGVAGNIG